MSRHRIRVRTTAALALATLLTATAPALASASATSQHEPTARPAPTGPYVPVGRGTHFLDHSTALEGVADPEWYESNIPFVDIPDQAIQDTYYYRWRTFKEALKYTGPDDGWIVTEFLGPVGYAAPGGAISAAAGHHLYEGRWLRDQRYLDDYLDYWLTGPGAGAKPATEGLGKDTTDWAHQYSFWVADAALAKAEIDGRIDQATARLSALERQWRRWSPQYNKSLGLYWQTPVWDAMEYTASSYQSDDPYHGGAGYRPTLNSYQYGDAKAIATLAGLAHEPRVEHAYDTRAAKLAKAQEKYLWDAKDGFYKHVMRDGNPDQTRSPTARRSASCRGTSTWPRPTTPPPGPSCRPAGVRGALRPDHRRAAQPLVHARGAGRLLPLGRAELALRHQPDPDRARPTSSSTTPPRPYVDSARLLQLLHGYALTQRKDGQPYVAEAHHPDEDRWLYDGRGHSEDYNHSTFNDIVLSSLFGMRGPDREQRADRSPLVRRPGTTSRSRTSPTTATT